MPETPNATLPVKAVSLFTSGVAHILREGEAGAGENSVALTFRTTQIADLLKSLVLLDSGGTVRAATLPTRDPVGRILQSFAVNIGDNPSRATLLKRLRGLPISLETTGGETLSGRILNVEEQTEILENEREVTREIVTLVGADGVTSVALDKVRRFRLLDARLEQELQDALVALASGSDDNRRTVTLTFSGEQARQVRVAYIVEAPVWKVSYRLVLDDTEKPYLQGWALVENTSDDDWQNVELSLISGRPVSFIQDLYTPLYVSRPVVGPDIVTAPPPEIHAATMDYREAMPEEESRMLSPLAAAAPATSKRLRQTGGRQIRVADMVGTAPTQAQGEQKGELFEYSIATPINLPRQQAAMIPLVSETIEGEKLSLYNADRDLRFPMNAFRLKNATTLHLKGGPLTVFDGGVYAGDARMEDIAPGEDRLITYAVDLAIEGERQVGQGKLESDSLTIKRGILHWRRFQRETTTYRFRSKAKVPRKLLIEHPFFDAATLREPEAPAERTAEFYRFPVTLGPGATASLRVVRDIPVMESIALMDAAQDRLFALSQTNNLTPEIRATLTEALERRRQIHERREAAAQRDQERARIHDEQKRIRDNMATLSQDSNLYRRYVATLDIQETRLSELLNEAEALRAEANRLQTEFLAYLDTLDS